MRPDLIRAEAKLLREYARVETDQNIARELLLLADELEVLATGIEEKAIHGDE